MHTAGAGVDMGSRINAEEDAMCFMPVLDKVSKP
jgi:hypothetical protein